MHWLTVRQYACAVSDKKILLNFTLSTLVNFKICTLVIFFIFSMNLNQIEAELMKVCVCFRGLPWFYACLRGLPWLPWLSGQWAPIRGYNISTTHDVVALGVTIWDFWLCSLSPIAKESFASGPPCNQITCGHYSHMAPCGVRYVRLDLPSSILGNLQHRAKWIPEGM